MQDGWNDLYEFAMFDARKSGESAIGPDFCSLMNEDDESDSSRSSSPANSITWANEMQFTEGEVLEECPFSEDDESVNLDFPEEYLNAWDDREWRNKYESAIEDGFQRIYGHNESIKNDPAKANMKPKDINPFWSHALQEIRHRNREEDEKVRANRDGFAELPSADVNEQLDVEVEDESIVSASAIYTATESASAIYTATDSGSDGNAIDNDAEEAASEAQQLQGESTFDSMPSLEGSTQSENLVNNLQEEAADVLVVEKQDEVIRREDIIAVESEGEMHIEELQEVAGPSRRFDYQNFKARLIEFRKRQEMEWIFGKATNK